MLVNASVKICAEIISFIPIVCVLRIMCALQYCMDDNVSVFFLDENIIIGTCNICTKEKNTFK